MIDNFQQTHCYECGKKINFTTVRKDNFIANMADRMPLTHPFERTYDYIEYADGSNPHWLCIECKRKLKKVLREN